MREIKFRVPMFKITTGRFSHFSYWGRIDTNGKSVTDNSCFCSPAQNNLTFPGEDEQYTGLHDKNGREIYEGDILRGLFGTHGQGASCRKEKAFNIQIAYNAPEFYFKHLEDRGNYRFYPSWSNCEVIGNIHENPELAKEFL